MFCLLGCGTVGDHRTKTISGKEMAVRGGNSVFYVVAEDNTACRVSLQDYHKIKKRDRFTCLSHKGWIW